jgi:hypothetical protein
VIELKTHQSASESHRILTGGALKDRLQNDSIMTSGQELTLHISEGLEYLISLYKISCMAKPTKISTTHLGFSQNINALLAPMI